MNYTVQQALRLRASPTTKGALVGQMPVGAVVTTVTDQQVTADGYIWVNVQYGSSQGWAALSTVPEIYLVASSDQPAPPPVTPPPVSPPPVTPPVQPPPPPPPVSTGSKMGLHIMPGCDAAGILGALTDLQRAGKPMAGVVLFAAPTNNLSARQIHGVSPVTEIMLRCYEADPVINWTATDLRAAGTAYMQRYYQAHLAGNADFLAANFHQIINELPRDNSQYSPGVASWWMGALDSAEAVGVKLAVLCFTTGQPPLPGDGLANSDFWQRADTLALLRRVKSGGHAFMLHQYAAGSTWDNDWLAQRHKRIYAVLPADLQDLPLHIGEFGDGHVLANGNDAFLRNVQLADNAFGTPVKWAALWCIGDGGAQWQPDRIDAALQPLKNYMLSR